MIVIMDGEVISKGSSDQILEELAEAVDKIALEISTKREVAIDVVIAELVLASTLGKYEIRMVGS